MRTLFLSCWMRELSIFTNIARLCMPLQNMFLIKGLFTYVVQHSWVWSCVIVHWRPFIEQLCDNPDKHILNCRSYGDQTDSVLNESDK